MGLTRSRTFSQPAKNAAQRNNPCSVHPLHARHCTPSSLFILQGHLPDQGKREGQGLRRAVNSIPSAAALSVEARFLVGSQVEARALRGHRGLPAGQSGGGWEGARPAGAGPVLAPQGSAHVRRAGWGSRAGASRFPARHGAADVARRRRGGRGRVRGVPEVRRRLRGARRPRAGPVPLAGGALEARAGPVPHRGRSAGGAGRGPALARWGSRNPFPGWWGRLTLIAGFLFL